MMTLDSTARAAAVAMTVLIGGCVRNTIASYPDQWPPQVVVSQAQCPRLAGRYHNAGEMAPGTRVSCGSNRFLMRAEWRCDTSLSRDLAEVESNEWVELRQPDADTLVIVSSDPVVDVKELHRSRGDFTCSARGLQRTLHASILSMGTNAPTSVPLAAFNGLNTLGGIATQASGGVRTLKRSFKTTADGSLIMDVSVSETGLFFLIPAHLKDETFVRWVREESSPVDSAAASAAGFLPTAGISDLPSAHFARFESMNDFLHRTRLTNVDGTEVDESKGVGRVAALSPGKRWVQVRTINHSLSPLLDFDTYYGFEQEALARHIYRLAQQPMPCPTPGSIDEALRSHEIGHAALSLIDKAEGQPERRFTVDALCISGMAASCALSDTGKMLDGLRCVRLNGSSYGFYGRDAVAN